MIYLALANFCFANFEIGSMVLWFAFLYCQNLLNYDRIISWLIFSSFFFFRVLQLSQCSLTFHNFWVINQDKECKNTAKEAMLHFLFNCKGKKWMSICKNLIKVSTLKVNRYYCRHFSVAVSFSKISFRNSGYFHNIMNTFKVWKSNNTDFVEQLK